MSELENKNPELESLLEQKAAKEAEIEALDKELEAMEKAFEADLESQKDKAKLDEYASKRKEFDAKHNELIKVRRSILSIETKELKAEKKELAAKYKEAYAELKVARKQLKSGEMSQEDFDAKVADVKAIEKEQEKNARELDKNESDHLLLMSKGQAFGYKFKKFFTSIPEKLANLGKKIAKFFVNLFWAIVNFFKDLGVTFVKGDWKTKISYFIMGFGSIFRGQWLRGIIFLFFEVAFIVYMVKFGGYFLGRLYILGEYESVITDEGTIIYGENSFNILLYGVLTMFFIVAFIYTWHLNIQQNKIAEQIIADEKKLDGAKDDLRALVDKNFHKTLLALPSLGIIIFTVLPIFFMILVAFTTYDANHNPPLKLFGWAGFDNFAQLFTWTNSGGASFSMTFGQILLWTLVWAFFATFTNYFLGMLVAMLINKKGIKLKKLWRTILVFSIAIPQFISILYVSQMFASDGIINNMIGTVLGWFHQGQDWVFKPIPFWENEWLARITVVVINIWIGVPYLMLIVTGILMNIPADLYESANIDGASAWQQYTKITLPYMLFITGPYLLTSFTGNMNNFNVIYLLTGGGPKDINMFGNAGKTDLLITWLFSLAINDSNYKLAAVIGIMVFIVVAVVSLVVYNLIPSTKNEEEFQ